MLATGTPRREASSWLASGLAAMLNSSSTASIRPTARDWSLGTYSAFLFRRDDSSKDRSVNIFSANELSVNTCSSVQRPSTAMIEAMNGVVFAKRRT